MSQREIFANPVDGFSVDVSLNIVMTNSLFQVGTGKCPYRFWPSMTNKTS
jgi:hypothetical protein